MPTYTTDTQMPVTTFEALSELICLSLNAHCTALFLPESDTTAFLKASFSTNIPTMETSTIAHGRGLVGWILRNKHSLIVNDFDKKNAFLGYYDPVNTPSVTAFMGVPFQQGGALCLDRTNGLPFTEQEQELLARFAAYSPLLIESSMQHAQLGEAQRFFEGLNHLVEARTVNTAWPDMLALILQILHACTGFEYTAFASLKDNDTYTLEAENSPILMQQGVFPVIPTSQGVVGWVFRNELPIYTEGTATAQTAPLFGKSARVPDFQATLCIPVFMEKNICAVICMAHTEPQIMSSQLRAFVQTIAYDLTQYLEHLTLRHRLHKALPKADMYRKGAVAYDPDSSPSQSPTNDA